MPAEPYNTHNTAQVDGFNRSVVKLEIVAPTGAVLGYGTGLLAQLGANQISLITALHNFSGRNRDGSYKVSCAVPLKVRINGPEFPAVTEHALYQDEEQINGLFYAHRSGGLKVDVAILPLGWSAPHHFQALDSSFFGDQNRSRVQLQVGQMCYVLGYPQALVHQNRVMGILPYWTTGHLASEPRVPFEDRFDYVIDAATNKGLSGAPVFVRNAHGNRLVGIYTGRLTEMGEATQLGLVVGTATILEVRAEANFYVDVRRMER